MPQPTKDRPSINKGPRSKTVKKRKPLSKSEKNENNDRGTGRATF